MAGRKQKVRFPWGMTSPLSLLLWGEHSPNPVRRLDTAPVYHTCCRGYWKRYLRLPFLLSGWPPLTRLLQTACACCRYEQTVALIERTRFHLLAAFSSLHCCSNMCRHLQPRALSQLFAGLHSVVAPFSMVQVGQGIVNATLELQPVNW